MTTTRDSMPSPLGVDVALLERGRFRLQLRGPLSNAWAARLSHHLRGAEVDVQQALAVRERDGTWTAELDCRSSVESPESLPWREWLSREPRGTPRWSPTLTRYRLVDSRRYDGSLELHVQGIDVPGFLSGLLRPIRQLALTPVALDIRTEHRRCDNRLWLREDAGGPVTSGARSRLELSLELAVKRSKQRAAELVPGPY